MRTYYSRTLRIISAVTLMFFSWTFLSLWQIPAAFAAEKQAPAAKGHGIGKENGEQKPEELFEGVLENIRETIGVISAKQAKEEDISAEIEAVKVKKTELKALDIEIRKSFLDTERKLKDAKLPQEILGRHYRFVKHYEDNIKELKSNLISIEQSPKGKRFKDAIQKAKLHLEKTKPPRKHVPLDPNNLPFQNRKAKKTREPRTTKKAFEKDFPPQSPRRSPRTASNLQDLMSADKGKLSPIAAANVHEWSRTKYKPVLLAYNDIASDMPLSLDDELRNQNYEPDTLIPDFAFPSPQNSELNTQNYLMAQTADLPTADDLAETPDIQFTDAIQAKATELGYNPVKIYEWVRNNIEFVPTYGSIQGADMCLQTMQCNAFDTSSLLISLLRSCSIPARYVYGTIEVPINRVMSCVGGFTDPKAALTLMASGGIPIAAKISGGKIVAARFETVWTEAWIDMIPSFGNKHKEGDSWVPLDPSFKQHDVTSELNLSKAVPFNESEYLSSQSSIPPSLAYFFTVEDYHTANYENTLTEILYGKKIKEETYNIFLGSLPYQVVAVGQKTPVVADTTRHKINISLSDPTGNKVTVPKNIVEIAGKKITVSYNPAAQQDAATIDNYGGLLKTPSYLLKIRPVIKADGEVILEGGAINPGSPMKLNIQFISPGQSADAIETDLAGGIYYTIGLSASNSPNNILSDRLDNLKSLTGTIYDSINTMDDQIGELLHNISLQYFGQVIGASKTLESQMHINNLKGVSAGFVFAQASYSYLFGIPSSPPAISGLMLDIQRYLQSPLSITGDAEQEREFTKVQGLNTSFYEHAVIENLMNIESVSAVKALQIARESGIPIYNITGVNINETLPLLTLSREVKNDIQNAVNAGKEVTISRDNILLNEWVGVGYIVRNPITGEGAYMISSGLAGGGTTQPVGGALMLLAGRIAALAVGTLRSVFKDVYHWFDEYYMSTVDQMLLGRGYITKYKETFSKQAFLKHFNRSDIWIAYFSGHGCVVGHDYIVPGYDAYGRPEYVYASDVHADTHIAFLNTCNSGVNLGFMSSFGVDQTYQGQPRDEVFIGWKGSIDWIESDRIGYGWWRNMVEPKPDGSRRSAYEAAYELGGHNGQYTESDPQNPNAPLLKFGGNQNTKLR